MTKWEYKKTHFSFPNDHYCSYIIIVGFSYIYKCSKQAQTSKMAHVH